MFLNFIFRKTSFLFVRSDFTDIWDIIVCSRLNSPPIINEGENKSFDTKTFFSVLKISSNRRSNSRNVYRNFLKNDLSFNIQITPLKTS